MTLTKKEGKQKAFPCGRRMERVHAMHMLEWYLNDDELGLL